MQCLIVHASPSGPKERATKEAILSRLEKTSNPFFNEHALDLFYSSTCSHCQRFAPTVKRWALYHHAKVIALALDNKPLPAFPNFKPATNQWVNAAFAGRSITYPALFVMNRKTHALYLVSTAMSDTTLNTRLMAQISKN